MELFPIGPCGVGQFAPEIIILVAKLANEGGLTDPDDVPSLLEEPRTKLGDLWLLGDTDCSAGTQPTHTTLP